MESLKFVNYKAFDEGEMELRPLTLLLGANSSGKSSILHLLLMLEQTINNSDTYTAAVKANGHSVSLGEDENLLKDRKHSLQMQLEFGIGSIEYINSIKKLLVDKELEFISNYLMFLRYHDPQKFKDTIPHMGSELLGKKSVKISPFLESVKELHNNTEFEANEILFNLLAHSRFVPKAYSPDYWFGGNMEILDEYWTSLNHCIKSFKNAFDPYPDKASIKYVLSFNENSRKLVVSECHVLVGDTAAIQIFIHGKTCLVSSDVIDNKDIEVLMGNSNCYYEFDSLSIKSKSESGSPFNDIVLILVEQAYKQVQSFFSHNNLSYVGPLRANPQRYYFLDDSNTNPSLDHSRGASLAEILKKNKPIREKINKWMSRFELNVDVKEFKDIIHNIKVTQNGLMLDIPDVGFGISQVLPILVEGLMAPSKATIIMEQPEIHLHPKMQAELADLFIDILNLQTKNKNKISKHLIIETHSEYIIKRIRRRMAEGLISPKHVAIYFVKPRNRENPDSAKLELAQISRDGSIDWPEEFYMTEMEDELAFFKAKIRKS